MYMTLKGTEGVAIPLKFIAFGDTVTYIPLRTVRKTVGQQTRVLTTGPAEWQISFSISCKDCPTAHPLFALLEANYGSPMTMAVDGNTYIVYLTTPSMQRVINRKNWSTMQLVFIGSRL